MLALGLSISLFVFWGVVGFALLAVLHTQRNLLQNMLLAPVVGMAATVLPIFFLNRSGLPVARFGVQLAAALLLLSFGLIWRLRPVVPLRCYMPFAWILLLAILMTGWPMLEFGFDWISYANDDMANYVLAAHRFLNHGFTDIPNVDDLVQGRDYSLSYWFMDMRGVRPGSQLLLAWVISVTGLTGHQIFMPVILALHIGLISATGALVHQSRRFRLGALLTCGMLSLSALTSLATLYQLIAQVGGLGLLIGCATLLFRPFEDMRVEAQLRQGLLASLLVSALSIVYPEVFPFLGVAFVLYVVVGLRRRRLALRPLLALLATVVIVGVALFRSYWASIFSFLIGQALHGFKPAAPDTSLFPFFLIPSGLASLWGLLRLTWPLPEPFQSTAILMGGLLLLAAAAASIVMTWRGQPAATLAFVMLSTGIHLFVQRADFGLYKLTMFIQPFLLATLVTAWLGAIHRPSLRIRPLIFLALMGVFSQTTYVVASRGVTSGLGAAFIEIPDGSRSRINTEFRQLVASTNAQHILLDTSNVVLAKFQALYIRGRDATFASRDFFGHYTRNPRPQLKSPDASISTDSQRIGESLRQRYMKLAFSLHGEGESPATNEFVINTIGQRSANDNDCDLLIGIAGRQSIFNRRQFPLDDSSNFVAKPCSDVHNHLIFIHSELGQHYYLGDSRRSAVYQLERDLFFIRRSMSGVGPHLLFQVINPSLPVRLLLDVTATLKGDGENRLPPAAAIGVNRQFFPIVGRGSARVFSPPLSPQALYDRAYVAIDMGVEGQRFPERRTGLMALYGTQFPRDRRRLVGFARDISLISQEEYTRLSPPSYLDTFPASLVSADLEYSGLYEDGWVSEAAFFQLTQPRTPAVLAVRGTVPIMGDRHFHTELRMMIDGREVDRRILSLGEFAVQVAAPQGVGRRRIDLRFSNLQRLPGRDLRPVAARLRFVGFESMSR